jgi:NAD(P)-dependent dehydrogenase (short-subunit alcohol dehydrogenase family)
MNASDRASAITGSEFVIDGGTKGVGKAIADRFQRGGATVIITARSAPTEKTDNHFIQADADLAEGTTKGDQRNPESLSRD